MAELNALLLSDGKPGHYRLAEGIAAAIARRRAITLTRLDVTRPGWLPARALCALTNRAATAAYVPRLLELGLHPVPACDLVVSGGGDTLAANILLARAYGCINIFYGSLRRYRPSDFSLVLTSYAANAARPNHAFAMKPSAFDPDGLGLRRLNALPDVTLGLLIGGDSGTVRYFDADWDRMLALLAHAPQAPRLIASNSRRTPPSVSDRIAALATHAAGRLRFIDVRQEGAAPLTQLLAASDVVAVTVDSSSMISEAIWARRPVVALAPRRAGLPALEQGYRDGLSRAGWLGSIALADGTTDAIIAAARALTPLQDNPLDQLAGLLASRLPALFS